MNITFAFPVPSLSGGCRVVAIYAQALANSGHNVTIVCPSHKYGGIANRLKCLLQPGRSPKKRLANSHFSDLQGVDIRQFSPAKLSNPKVYPDADILVGTWWKTIEWIRDFPEEKGRKFYFIQHYEVHDEHPRRRVENTYRTGFQKIVIATWLARTMATRYADNNSILVPNAVDRQEFFPVPEGGMPKQTLCSMYSELGFKGVDVTLAAFSSARKRFPEARLILFGAKPLPPETVLPDGAEFIHSPDKNALRKLYSSSRAYIFSSRSEGFGLPILEALACGCPVVATKSGCAPEYVLDGINGFVNDIDDIDGQAQGIEKILGMDDVAWSRMSDNALEAVAGSSWAESAKAFECALITCTETAPPAVVESVV